MSGRIKTFGAKREFQLPEIGRLSIGEKQKNERGQEYPAALDYFRLYNADEKVAEAFRETYGEKPAKILVSFFQSDPEKVCNQRFEMRVGRRKFAEGDGQLFYYHDAKTRKQVTAEAFSEEERDVVMAMIQEEAEKAARAAGIKGRPEWVQRLTLRLWLPEVPFVGEFLFNTKGAASSIKNIVNAFDMVLGAAGTVQRVPFELSVKIHDSDSMATTRYPVVTLKPLLDGDSLRQVGELGEKLFDSMRDLRRGVLHLLNAEDIGEGAKRLEAGKGSPIVQSAPSNQEPPEPSEEMQRLADSDEAWQDVTEATEENASAFNDVETMNPDEMTPADGIKYLKANKGFEDVRTRWSRLLNLQRDPAVFRCFWLCLIQRTPDKQTLDSIVRENPQLHGYDWFKAGVQLQRKTTG